MDWSTTRQEELLQILQDTRPAGRPPEKPDEIRSFASLADRTEWKLEAAGFPFSVYLFRAKNQTDASALYINLHGGGWFTGYRDSDALLAAYLADRIQGVVLDVDYTTSQDASWSVMFAQCCAAAAFARSHAAAWNCDPRRLVLGGFSAGGHLAAGTVLKTIADGQPFLAAQILCYAPLDLRREKPPVPSGDPLAERRRRRGDAYEELAHRNDPAILQSPYFSPAGADPALLAQCPPTLVISAGQCEFNTQDEAYAFKLASLGVETTAKRFPEARHGFIAHFGSGWQQAADLIRRYILQTPPTPEP